MAELSIPALDGHALATTHYPGSNPKGPVILISSGVAIPRRYYRYFAKWLAGRGARLVICWDYRGIGDSWPPAAKGDERKFDYLMSDWALKDYPAMIDWIGDHHKGRKIYTIGHSFGGQAFGLADRNVQVDKSVLIASMSGYWRKMAFPANYKAWFSLLVLGDLAGRIYGYVPGKFGLGEDISYRALKQWAKWCRHQDYFFGDPELPQTRYFADYRGPMLAIGLDDDDWATPELIDHLVDHFTEAQLERRQFSVGQAGGKIGHFGFFKPQFEENLWGQVGDWLFEG